jgi:IS4 transposase
MVQYGVTTAGDSQWHGLTLKVAHVIERFLKPKRGHPDISEFWVITTDEKLSAEDMRELAHLRWSIENRSFRRLNHLVRSKRHVTNNPHVREALLGLWFIGLNLFGLLLAWSRMGRLNARLKPVKKT